MDSGFLALASGPALLVVYYLNMKRLPATFPHWFLYRMVFSVILWVWWFLCVKYVTGLGVTGLVQLCYRQPF